MPFQNAQISYNHIVFSGFLWSQNSQWLQMSYVKIYCMYYVDDYGT